MDRRLTTGVFGGKLQSIVIAGGGGRTPIRTTLDLLQTASSSSIANTRERFDSDSRYTGRPLANHLRAVFSLQRMKPAIPFQPSSFF